MSFSTPLKCPMSGEITTNFIKIDLIDISQQKGTPYHETKKHRTAEQGCCR